MKQEILPRGLTKNGLNSLSDEPAEILIESLGDIIEFIDTYFVKRKSINYKHSSYGLKHVIERCIGKYVSNGELIAAMVICGYDYKSRREGALNCNFNVGAVNEKKIKNKINPPSPKNYAFLIMSNGRT